MLVTNSERDSAYGRYRVILHHSLRLLVGIEESPSLAGVFSFTAADIPDL